MLVSWPCGARRRSVDGRVVLLVLLCVYLLSAPFNIAGEAPVLVQFKRCCGPPLPRCASAVMPAAPLCRTLPTSTDSPRHPERSNLPAMQSHPSSCIALYPDVTGQMRQDVARVTWLFTRSYALAFKAPYLCRDVAALCRRLDEFTFPDHPWTRCLFLNLTSRGQLRSSLDRI